MAAEGKVESAISAFQKAVKLGSNFPFNPAIVKELTQENKVKEAEKLLRAFIELDHNINLLPKTEVREQNPLGNRYYFYSKFVLKSNKFK
ncbi:MULTISPECIES: hypothetical protein [unclassified Okeania]|uniref:hypothetical protein n=1 Tax=unclassified Okeania TaxID=2634635 RepID=UPI0013BD6A1D|nr:MULTISPECIES: hypothetical protein [unclassified Okeania]NES76128.1 hypothetical protein [Okeania sp. SIO1H4]NET19393.1 hypothetical protein [Okeania sp. SIO1H5]NET95962.1 hypothetical protein [Okeania sp. SIO1H2]